ncbi:hypothetical protein Tco_1126224, partial [Tanacetum coccineum]
MGEGAGSRLFCLFDWVRSLVDWQEWTNGGVIKGSGVDGNFKGDGFRLGVGPVYHLNGFRLYLGFRVYKAKVGCPGPT